MHWNLLPAEVVERIFSYVIADQLRDHWGRWTALATFEDKPTECGTPCSYIFPVLRALQFQKACRPILKGMCVFKPCIKGDKDSKGKLQMEYDLRFGLLHK